MEAGLLEELPANSERLSSWNPAWRPDTQSHGSSHDSSRITPPLDFTQVETAGQVESHDPTGSAGLISNTSNIRLEVEDSQDVAEQHHAGGLLENEVDPAWGLSPETFRLEHTNTFPAVPPLHSDPGLPPIHSLPTSQIEDIMAETAAEVEAAEDEYNFDTGVSGNQPSASRFEDLVNAPKEASHTTSNAVVSLSTTTPPAEESRFEEGLPLLSSDATRDASDSQNSIQHTTDFFGSDPQQQGTGEDFFGDDASEVPDEASFFKPSGLERKTTSQVLESISYPQRNEVHDATSSFEQPYSLENITESSMEEPENREEPAGAIIEQEGQHQSPAKNEEDLAAVWQVALADDDFLEEDPSLDPTAFFEDDGDGFLEETQPTDLSQGSGFPSASEAVTHSDRNSYGYSTVEPGAQRSMSFNANTQTRYAPQSTNTTAFDTRNSIQQSLYGPGTLSSGYSATTSFDSSLGQQSLQSSTPLFRPGMPEKAESFADKSKGGYTSPYDLPIDVSRPKKRATVQHLQSSGSRDVGTLPPPPPRSSSIQSVGMTLPSQSVYQPQSASASGPAPSPSTNSPIAFSPSPASLKSYL
jgi:hypothetical protein